jgi:hypothetical protein
MDADAPLGLAALKGPHSAPDTDMDPADAVEEAKSPDNTRAGAILSNAATPTGQDGRPSNWSRLTQQEQDDALSAYNLAMVGYDKRKTEYERKKVCLLLKIYDLANKRAPKSMRKF